MNIDRMLKLTKDLSKELVEFDSEVDVNKFIEIAYYLNKAIENVGLGYIDANIKDMVSNGCVMSEEDIQFEMNSIAQQFNDSIEFELLNDCNDMFLQ